MIGEVAIANSALRLVGQDAITSFDDGTDRAFDVTQYYTTSLESFLSEFNWSFATREAKLMLATKDKTQFDGEVVQEQISDEYKYCHLLPNDFMRLTGFIHKKTWCDKQRIKYNIRLYREQLAIYSDVQLLTMLYISRAINYDSLSAQAREAIILRLAIFLDTVRNGGSNIERLNSLYQNMLYAAIRQEPSTHERRYLDIGDINRARIDPYLKMYRNLEQTAFVDTPFPEIP